MLWHCHWHLCSLGNYSMYSIPHRVGIEVGRYIHGMVRGDVYNNNIVTPSIWLRIEQPYIHTYTDLRTGYLKEDG